MRARRRRAGDNIALVPPSKEDRREALKAVYQQAKGCTNCPQLAATRTTVVFGSGNADADLMFVGEAPGANEDRQGVPFVGQAGKLLDTLLGEIGLSRAEVWVTNTLKCRPPGNRDPHPAEIEACQGYLMRQVELIEPRVICTLGNFATKLLRGDPTGITRLHGREEVRVLGSRAVRLYPIFHPAAALYTPANVEVLRADFGRLPELLALAPPEQPRADETPATPVVEEPPRALPDPEPEREPEAGGARRAVPARALLIVAGSPGGVHEAAARGFARSAAAYDRGRPEYPGEAVAWLAERLGLGPGRRVLDLAAGTGKLTRPLLATGAAVAAVEPVSEMRARIGSGVEVLDGTAEAIPLADGASTPSPSPRPSTGSTGRPRWPRSIASCARAGRWRSCGTAARSTIRSTPRSSA